MLGELRHGDMSQQRLGGQSALDQRRRRLGLNDAAASLRAGIAGTDRHQDPKLRRSDIQPFRPVLADPHHVAAAAGTCQVLGLDHPLFPRQVLRQAPRPSRRACRPFPRPPLDAGVMLLGGGGDRDLDVLEGQFHLVGVELLGPGAKAGALQFSHEMLETVVARAEVRVLRLQVLAQLRRVCQRLFELRLDRGAKLGRQLGQEGRIERGGHGRKLPDTAASPQQDKRP